MPDVSRLQVAIVDYGMGNLFSVRQACEATSMDAVITSSKHDVMRAEAVIVPGVGSFGDAMETLHRLDLVSPLRDLAMSGRPLIGVCLGMQLLMTESEEFGRHRGLGLIEGEVLRLDRGNPPVKVPHVGWNRIASTGRSWANTPLAKVADGEPFYFVHSYRVAVGDSALALSTTTYGGTTFCSSLSRGNIFGCQFHPERSGEAGLSIYRGLNAWCRSQTAALEPKHV